MIQLKDKLKVNGGTRQYMEMIGLSLAFSLFAVSCTQDSDTFYPSSPEEEHPSVDESRMIPIQLSVDGVWTIDSNNVTFISHDDSITTVNDLYPGMMVQVLCYDEVIDAIFPTPLHDVAYIETWGEYNFDLYDDGVKILNGVQ